MYSRSSSSFLDSVAVEMGIFLGLSLVVKP